MKINKGLKVRQFDELEGGEVFLFEDGVFLTLRESCYDNEGDHGQEYDAVDLETGELRFFFGSESVRPIDVTLDL